MAQAFWTRVSSFNFALFFFLSFFSRIRTWDSGWRIGVAWNWLLDMGNTIGWAKVFENLSAHVATLDLSRYVGSSQSSLSISVTLFSDGFR